MGRSGARNLKSWSPRQTQKTPPVAAGRWGGWEGYIVTLLTQKTPPSPSTLNNTHGVYRAVEGEGGVLIFYVHSGVEPDKDPNVVHRCAPPYHRRGAGSFAGVQVRSSRHADPPFTLSPESNLTAAETGSLLSTSEMLTSLRGVSTCSRAKGGWVRVDDGRLFLRCVAWP